MGFLENARKRGDAVRKRESKKKTTLAQLSAKALIGTVKGTGKLAGRTVRGINHLPHHTDNGMSIVVGTSAMAYDSLKRGTKRATQHVVDGYHEGKVTESNEVTTEEEGQ